MRDQPDITDRDFEPSFSEEAFAQIAAMELGRFYRGKNLPFRVDAWKPTLEVWNVRGIFPVLLPQPKPHSCAVSFASVD